MKKSLSNKLDELKNPKPRDQKEIEKKLLPRLTFMAYVMYSLCIASVLFAIFAPKVDDAEPAAAVQESGFPGSLALDAIAEFLVQKEEVELNPTEVLNFYLVGAVFASLGVACMWIEKKKRKILLHHTPPGHHP